MTTGCKRRRYSINEYIAYRTSTLIPIVTLLDSFRAYATTHAGAFLQPDEWITVWNQFCDWFDAKDERETQADALR